MRVEIKIGRLKSKLTQNTKTTPFHLNENVLFVLFWPKRWVLNPNNVILVQKKKNHVRQHVVLCCSSYSFKNPWSHFLKPFNTLFLPQTRQKTHHPRDLTLYYTLFINTLSFIFFIFLLCIDFFIKILINTLLYFLNYLVQLFL